MFNRLNKLKKNKKGFTLIELLVVIAVIAILIAIIAPNFISATDKANEGATNAIQHNFDSALERFYAENNRYPSSDSDKGLSSAANAPQFVPDYFNNYSSNEKFTVTIAYTGTKPVISVSKKTSTSTGTGN